MSQVAISNPRSSSAGRLVADSFSRSIVLVGCLIILQRGIGFLRSFYVCGALSPADVGQWDLAFSFLTIAAPLAVFGIPGSFGRYVARFEKHGQQRVFLNRTLVACLGLTFFASVAIWILRRGIAQHFFGGIVHQDLVAALALGLPLVVFFNFATSWFTGRRLTRFVFRVQFAQTLFFACLCLLSFQLFSATALAVIVSYFLSCLFGTSLAASYAFLEKSPNTSGAEPEERLSIWNKILPFAFWVWISNALFNLFAVCDRLLLVNFHPNKLLDVQVLVGQYHTACIFPLLLMSLGAMAGSMLIPYLSKDWESGDRDSVTERMNLMLKAIGLLCLTASIGILFLAPLLFGGLWKDKFALGESLLPITLGYSSLAAMNFLAQKYFWCIERTWLSSSTLLIGLVFNFALGLTLIGPYGIEGVVVSTLVSHAVVLASVLVLCIHQGLRIDFGVFVIAVVLLSICFGATVASVCFAGLLFAAMFTPILFTDSQKSLAVTKLQSLRSSLTGSIQ